MKKNFSVLIENWIYLQTNQMRYLMRIAPKYVLWGSYGYSDVVLRQFKTRREANVFVSSFYVLMETMNFDLNNRVDSLGDRFTISCKVLY